ncbi:hypothetical protein C8J56DRAFT_1062186 [Mycena floridula]|nr:hypothetical protein C8J56DRAFT_1062186 [Mycena floridula]
MLRIVLLWKGVAAKGFWLRMTSSATTSFPAVFLATTVTGDFPLPVQLGGRIDKSLPSKRADRMPEALERGFQFIVAARMGNWHHPYGRGVIEADPELPDDQMVVIYVDIYPVHTGQAFRSFVFNKHPNIVLGIFQPADVGIQRIAKHHLKQYIVGEQQKEIDKGIDPDSVKLSTSLPKLRGASVAGLVELYDFMNGPDG